MQYYIKALKKYAEFEGRTTRKEFWMFVLFHVLIMIGLMILDNLLGLADSRSGYGVLTGLYGLAVFIPGLAISMRRLHDIGKSGWWLLLNFIPLIGPLVLIVFYVIDSEKGSNEYGPNPKSEMTQTHEQGSALENEPPKTPPVTKEKSSHPTPPPVPGEQTSSRDEE